MLECVPSAVTCGGPVISCVDLCGDLSSSTSCTTQCSGDRDRCASRSYRFELTGMSDDAILEACTAATKRDAECDEEKVGTLCEVYARVERHDVARLYSVLASWNATRTRTPASLLSAHHRLQPKWRVGATMKSSTNRQ